MRGLGGRRGRRERLGGLLWVDARNKTQTIMGWEGMGNCLLSIMGDSIGLSELDLNCCHQLRDLLPARSCTIPVPPFHQMRS